uniref:Uncharacterized protein n=1 Tax=Cacopsylla melanoneura TaxID=428564 RepID=A0A8D8R1S4_9HEMI
MFCLFDFLSVFISSELAMFSFTLAVPFFFVIISLFGSLSFSVVSFVFLMTCFGFMIFGLLMSHLTVLTVPLAFPSSCILLSLFLLFEFFILFTSPSPFFLMLSS